MGYSVAIHCKNLVLKKEMFGFMEKYYRDVKELFRVRSNSRLSDDLSYDHGENTIGFDYSVCSSIEHHYIYTIISWMGIKVGKKRKFGNLDAVPHYTYDGEWEPILVNINVDNYTTVDELGFCSIGAFYDDKQKAALNEFLPESITINHVDRIIKGELRRLEAKWEKGE